MGNTYIFDDSHDYTGAVATFTDTHGTSRITNISVPFSPIQDLHGYSHPWPAGGGANRLNPATVPEEGGYIRSNSGLVNSNTSWRYSDYIPVTPGEALYFGEVYATASTAGTAFYDSNKVYVSGVSATSLKNSNGVMTVPEGVAFMRHSWLIDEGYNENWETTVYIIPNSSPHEFTPYSNICPISGRTGLSVYRTGINVWDEQWERGTIGVSTGAKVDDNTKIRSKNYVPISPNTAYYYKFPGNWRMVYFDSNKNVVERGNTYSPNIILTSPATAHYLLFALDATTEYDNNIAINYPATDHDYHAYNGNTYAVDWTSEAGTVYGGTVDVVTGVLTIDKAYKAFDGTENWGIVNGAYFMTVVGPLNSVVNDSAISTHYPYASGISVNNYKTGFTCYNRPASPYTGAVVLVRPEAPLTTSLADFKAWLATQNTNGTPFAVCYELATPLTYQLTAQEVGVIKNSLNNVWASTGSSITVTVKDIAYGFQGWLVKVGSSLTLVPTEMIEAESYKVTPDQRMEESAERDTTGYLWRDTVRNTPPKIEFNTPPVNNTQVAALNAIFQSAFTVKSQRKLQVAFFDPEEDCYKIWDCYMPDVEYPMHLIDPDAKTILYDSIRYAFIGY